MYDHDYSHIPMLIYTKTPTRNSITRDRKWDREVKFDVLMMIYINQRRQRK